MPEAGDEPYARVACLRSTLADQLERLRDRVTGPARWVVQPGVAVVDVTASPERSARPSDHALALMRDIKQGLDPRGLFPPLGFHPDLD
jgi:hypothetical protein